MAEEDARHQTGCQPTLDRCYLKARRLAKEHRAYIEAVAKLLMEKGTLTDAEIPELKEAL